jgi:DnaJ-class molecular chaperone
MEKDNQFIEVCERCKGSGYDPYLTPENGRIQQLCTWCHGKGCHPNKLGKDLLEFLKEFGK